LAPLTWENFLANIDPERLGAACFKCDSCDRDIQHSDKERIMRGGRWVPKNPNGDHPGFHLWRAYAPQRDWASIAVEYARLMGWTRIEGPKADAEASRKSVEAETEQTFFNDVLGLPYEQASDAPDWEDLRDRTENADEEAGILPIGILPSCGVLFGAGVDCQDDRIEVSLYAFGANRRRWMIDHIVIPHSISEEAGGAALDALLKKEWRTSLGLKLKIDILAIDGGTYTDDVWSWAKRHPWSRVIIVKGASTQNGPFLMPMKFERRNDGRAKRAQKRGFMVNVSMMKGNFYTWLGQSDISERGYCAFASGLVDEVYRQVSSEKKILSRNKAGVTTSSWVLVEPSRRNEVLDCSLYAEAGARRKGWASMTDDQWEILAEARGKAPEGAQADLFDRDATTVEETSADIAAPKAPEKRLKLSEILKNANH
jgi:phage terminase large subunit GpA-like protein